MFEVILDDTTQLYSVYFSKLIIEHGTDNANATKNLLTPTPYPSEKIVFLDFIGLSTVVLVLGCGFLQVVITLKALVRNGIRGKNKFWIPFDRTAAAGVHDADDITINANLVRDRSGNCSPSSTTHKILLLFYICFKLLYSVVFTFTFVSILLTLWAEKNVSSKMILGGKGVGGDGGGGGGVEQFSQWSNRVHFIERIVDETVGVVTYIQKCKQDSCEDYIVEHLRTLWSNVDTTTNIFKNKQMLSHAFVDHFKFKYDAFLRGVKSFVSRVSQTFEKQIGLDLLRRSDQVDRTTNISWFLYPKSLFDRIPVITHGTGEVDVADGYVNFADFVGVYDAPNVNRIRVWQSAFRDQ